MPGNIINLGPEDVAGWPTANYDDPVTRPWLPIYSSILFVAATLMIAMRYWLRIRGHAGKLGLDDVGVTSLAGRMYR